MRLIGSHWECDPMAFSGVPALSLPTHRRELFAVVVANAISLTGVGLLGWDISALVVLYWVELAVTCCFAVIPALFADRHSDPGQNYVIGFRTDLSLTIGSPVTSVPHNPTTTLVRSSHAKLLYRRLPNHGYGNCDRPVELW